MSLRYHLPCHLFSTSHAMSPTMSSLDHISCHITYHVVYFPPIMSHHCHVTTTGPLSDPKVLNPPTMSHHHIIPCHHLCHVITTWCSLDYHLYTTCSIVLLPNHQNSTYMAHHCHIYAHHHFFPPIRGSTTYLRNLASNLFHRIYLEKPMDGFIAWINLDISISSSFQLIHSLTHAK